MLEEMENSQAYADFLAARYAGMSGDPVAAAAYYRRAFERSPNDPTVLERAVLSTLVAGEVEQAIRLVTGVDPAVSAQSPTAQLALVVNDIGTGRARRALTRLQTTSLGAINSDAAGFLAAWLVAAGDPGAGLAALSELPQRRMLAAEQEVLRGLILMSAGRDAEAASAFEQAARLPMGEPALLMFLHARLLAANGDLAGARKLAEQHLEAYGPGSETEAVLALAASGKPAGRVEFNVREGAALAMHLASSGGVARTSAEIATMRESLVLHLDSNLSPARFMLAEALSEQGRAEAAIDVLRATPSGSAYAASAKLQEAWLLDRLDRPAEALAAAEEALAKSRRRDIVVGAADLYRVNGNDRAAASLYSEVIAADAAKGGPDWRVLFARAAARNGMDDWSGAEADLLAALAIEPDRPELQNFLGYGWVNRGQKVEEGMELIRKAVEARPDQGFIVDSLGWAHYALGEYDEAVKHLERAAELSPTDPEIIEHLGDAYWRAGRETDAIFEWRRALEFDPKSRQRADLETKLARGLPPEAPAALADANKAQQ